MDRLTSLVEDLLDVSKISAGKLSLNFEEVNLLELVSDVRDLFDGQLVSAGFTLAIEIDQGIFGNWDRMRMEQVLLNLISNSIKYAAVSAIVVTAEVHNSKMRMVFRDFGPGIEKAKQGRIFERFERATSSRNISGLGLGLFIINQIVSAHGRSLRVESEVGVGSRVITEFSLDARSRVLI